MLRNSLPALLLVAVGCTSIDVHSTTSAPAPAPQSNAELHAELREFGAHYGYDVGYMEELLDLSRSSFDLFYGSMGMSLHREHLPLDAHHVACISALLADGCSECTQLCIKMALEEGVDRELLRTLLEDPASLPHGLRLVHDHAAQIVRGENANEGRVQELRALYGDAAFGELAVNVLGSRIYPALRRSLGAEYACPLPTVDV